MWHITCVTRLRVRTHCYHNENNIVVSQRPTNMPSESRNGKAYKLTSKMANFASVGIDLKQF